MSIDHIVIAIIGVVGTLYGLYLLSKAKAYKARHNHDTKHHNGAKHT